MRRRITLTAKHVTDGEHHWIVWGILTRGGGFNLTDCRGLGGTGRELTRAINRLIESTPRYQRYFNRNQLELVL